MVSYQPLVKLLQRKLYTLIGSTNTIDLILLGILCILICGGIVAASLGIHLRQLMTLFHGEACITGLNNIGRRDFSPRLCHEPIDVVYTWVNGSDPVWFAQMVKYKKEWMTREGMEQGEGTGSNEGNKLLTSVNVTNILTYNCSTETNASLTYTLVNVTEASTNHTELLKTNTSVCILLHNTSHIVPFPTTADSDITEDNLSSMNRYRDNDELRYSVRSLFKYAPWIRYVHFVTNGQVPAWLDTEHPRVRVVSHSDIFLNQSHLPVFSSPAIEVHLHRIPGISNRFIYLNDDVFFGSDTWPDDFVTGAQGQKVYLAWEVPKCAPGCMDSWLGDGYCDTSCNTSRCLWDGGDCFNNTKTRSSTSYNYKVRSDHSSSSSSSSSTTTTTTSSSSSSSSTPPVSMDPCVPGCPDNWIGDKVCDTKCNYAACGWDGGDCGIYKLYNTLPGTTVRYNVSSISSLSSLSSFSSIVSSTHDSSDTFRLRGNTDGSKATLQRTQQSMEQSLWKSILGSITNNLENLQSVMNITWLDTNRTTNITQLQRLNSADVQTSIKFSSPSLFTIAPVPLLIPVLPPVNDTHIAVYANLTESMNQMMHLHYFNHLFQNEYLNCKNTSLHEVPPNGTNITTDQWIDQQTRKDIECLLERIRTWSTIPVTKIVNPELFVSQIDGADVSSQSLVRLAILSTQHKVFMVLLRKSELQREQRTPLINKTITTVKNNQNFVHIHDINVWMRIKFIPNINITNSSTEEWIKRLITETGELTFAVPIGVPVPVETDEEERNARLGNITKGNSSTVTGNILLPNATSATANRTIKDSTIKNSTQRSKPRKLLEEEELSNNHRINIRTIIGNNNDEPNYESATVYNRARMDAWSTIRRLKTEIELDKDYQNSGIMIQRIVQEAWQNFAQYSNKNIVVGRKLTDTYGDSLVHTNRLITAIFGKKNRKVPAHMPHFIDVSAMEKLQDKWPEEFDETSSHRFRDSFDIQYAFAYFHFLMEGGAREGLDVETYFSKELDSDGDGRLNENELRTLVAIVLKKSPPNEEIEKIRECLAPSEVHTIETHSTVGNNELIETKTIRTRPYITWESIVNCQAVVDGLSKNARFAATHQEMSQDEVAFEMVRKLVSIKTV